MMMLLVVAMASVATTIFVGVALVIIVFDLVMMWLLYLPVIMNVTLRCISVCHLLYERVLNDRCRCYIPIVIILVRMVIVIAMIKVLMVIVWIEVRMVKVGVRV